MIKNQILIVTSEFPPQPGGIGNHAYNLAQQLTNESYQVTVLTDNRSKTGEEEKQFDSNTSFTVCRVSVTSPRIGMYLKRFSVLFHLIKEHDVVIASGKFSLWMVAFVSLFYKKKYLAVIHGTEVNFQHNLKKLLINKSLRRFQTVVAVSAFTRSLVSQVRLKNVVVIPNGFSFPGVILTGETNPKLTNKPILITVGNVTERKGQLNVIKMLPEVIKKYPSIHYHCVGIPTQKDEYLTEAKKLGVEEYISFHGKISEQKKIELLKNSDIFVMLSQNTRSGDVEGFGIAILEANFLGKPAIGSLGCGIEDAIKDGETGYLIGYDQTEVFIDSIEKILGNYAFFSKQAKYWAEKYTWNKIINQYCNVIENE